MACKGQYVFLITATLLVLISSSASICRAANQDNPHRSPISPQMDWPGDDPDVTTSQTGLRVLVPSVTQGPDSKEINDIWNEHYALSLDEPVPAIPDFLSQPGAAPQGSRLEWFSLAPITQEETGPPLLGTATNSNPNNRLIAKGLPSTRIDTGKEFSPNPWMYSLALIAFVVYARRRGGV